MRRDFTPSEIRASYKVNTVLARALYAALSFGTYERFQAHIWALRVISADPKSGEDMAAATVNFDYMAANARANYQSNPVARKRADELFAIYTKWKASNGRAAA